MGRLIDAEALVKQLTVEDRWIANKTYFIERIEAAPTIEAEPVRHGRWECWVDEECGLDHARCNECGHVEYDIDIFKLEREGNEAMFYCGRCGAKMDLEG